jgi:hypothetical protein
MLEGNLVHVPIGAVLQMLQVEQLSGVLYVTEGPRTIVLAMTDGLIDFAYAENAGSEFRLGRMLVEQGILTKEQIDVAVAHQSAAAPPMPPPQAAGVLGAGSSDKQKRPPMGSIPVEKILQESPAMAYRAPAQTLLDLVEVASDAPEPLPESVRRLTPPPPNPTGRPQPLLGDLLIAQGMITEAQLRGALAHQSSELTYEVIRWKRGTFRLRREPLPPLAQSIRLHLPVAHLVMEGFRRVDEWRVIEETVGSLEGVLQRDTVAMDPRALESLDKKERDLLALVDGERSIRDVLDASPMSRFEGCKILFQLLEVRFVRRKTSA